MAKEKPIITKLIDSIEQRVDSYEITFRYYKDYKVMEREKTEISALVRHFQDTDRMPKYNRLMLDSTLQLTYIFKSIVYRITDMYMKEWHGITYKMHRMLYILLDENSDNSLWNTNINYRDYRYYIYTLVNCMTIHYPELLVAIKHSRIDIEAHYYFNKKRNEELKVEGYYDITWYDYDAIGSNNAAVKLSRVSKLYYKDMLLIALSTLVHSYKGPDDIYDLYTPEQIIDMRDIYIEAQDRYAKRAMNKVEEERKELSQGTSN